MSVPVAGQPGRNEMTLLDDIKKTVRTDIALFAKLRDVLIREQYTARETSSETGGEELERRDAIERSIENTNARLAELFQEFKRREHWITEDERLQVEKLSADLKEAIDETMRTVEMTIDTIQDSRKHIVSRIRELDSKKSAVKAYQRLKTSAY